MLRELYQQADVAFVGGTFCDVGGHNLAEPSLFGVPAMYGPNVHAQRPLHELLFEKGAAFWIADPVGLYASTIILITHSDIREQMSDAARRLREDSQGLTSRIAARILEIAGLSVV